MMRVKKGDTVVVIAGKDKGKKGKKKKQEAFEFVEEQKDLSSDLEEQHN